MLQLKDLKDINKKFYTSVDFEKNLKIIIPITINVIPKIPGMSNTWLYLKYPINEINSIPIPLHIAYVIPTDISFNTRDIK